MSKMGQGKERNTNIQVPFEHNISSGCLCSMLLVGVYIYIYRCDARSVWMISACHCYFFRFFTDN